MRIRSGSGGRSGDDRNRRTRRQARLLTPREPLRYPSPRSKGGISCSTTIWPRSSRPRSRTASGSASTRKGEVREAVEAALELLDRGELRVAEKTAAAGSVHQWLKKAVLLSFRLNDMSRDRGRPGRVGLVGQGPVEVRGLGRGTIPRSRVSRRAGLRRPPIGLHRAGRGADAVLRQCWRLCRQRHHDRHLGVDQLLRADRQELPHFGRGRHWRRARAPAGGTGGDRGRLLHRRPRRGGRRRRRRARLGTVDGRLSRRLDQDRRPDHGRGISGPRAALFGGHLRHSARQAACRTAVPGPGSTAP